MITRLIKLILYIFIFIFLCQFLVSCKPLDTGTSTIANPPLKKIYKTIGKNINFEDNINTDVNVEKSLNKGSNGTWIGPKWIREDQASVNKLLEHLMEFEINRLYLNLGEIIPLKTSKNVEHGSSYQFEVYFNGYNINNEKAMFADDDYKMLRNLAANIRNFNKNNNYDCKMIGVINGNEKYDLLNNCNEYKTDSLINIVKTTINFFNSDELQINKEKIFDGFQLDIEPVNGGNAELLKLLSEVKNILPENQALSIVISQIGTENGSCVCSDDYIKDSVASILRPGDEIALMAYNLGLNLDDYKNYIADQAYNLIKSLSPKKIDSAIYIPLYPEDNKNTYHSSNIENIENALSGLLLIPKLEEVTDNSSRVIIYNYDELYGTKEWIEGFNNFKNLWIDNRNRNF
jgi:hypothetical protein